MDSGDCRAIKRCIKITPFARWHHWPSGEPKRLKQLTNANRISREHFAEQCNRWPIRTLFGRSDRALLCLATRIGKHSASQHILCLSMGWHAETGHINPDDADAVDFLGQQLQRNARCGRHAEVGNDYGIIKLWVCDLKNRVTNILEQLASDERFGIKRHITNRPPRAVEMRSEGQPVNAAGRT